MYKFSKQFRIFELIISGEKINLELSCTEPEVVYDSNLYFKTPAIGDFLDIRKLIEAKLQNKCCHIQIDFTFSDEPLKNCYLYQIDDSIYTTLGEPNGEVEAIQEITISISTATTINTGDADTHFSLLVFNIIDEETQKIQNNPYCTFSIGNLSISETE